MAGWIYVMKNEAMPGLVKIGRSSQDPSIHRVKELSSSTSVPVPFTVSYQALVNNEIDIEKKLHEHFKKNRYGKEYFKDISPQQVALQVSELTDTLHEDTHEFSQDSIQREVVSQQLIRQKSEDEEWIIKFQEGWLEHKRMQVELETFISDHSKAAEKEGREIQKVIDVLGWPPDLNTKNGILGSTAELFGWQSKKQIAASDKGLSVKLRGWKGFGRIVTDQSIQAGSFWGRFLHGHCTVRWFNGDLFCGMFKEDEKHGWGIYQNASGNSYKGLWSHDKKDMWGIDTDKRVTYSGELRHGLKHGYGEVYFTGKLMFRGLWETGERVFGWGPASPNFVGDFCFAFWHKGSISRRCNIENLAGFDQSSLEKLNDEHLS